MSVAVNVPDGAEPLEHRAQIQARARELGWPDPHSAGASFAHKPRVLVDLAWTLPLDEFDNIVIAVHTLRDEFDVRDVHVVG